MKIILKWTVGVLFAVLLPIFFVTAFAIAWLSHERDNLQDSAERYSKLLGISHYKIPLAGEPSVINELLLGHSDTAVTLAELQSKLRNLAAQRGMLITQANQVDGEKLVPETSSISKVAIHLEFGGRAESVIGFFSDIEQARPLLFIERVSILSSDQEGMPQTEEAILYVSADIWGAVANSGAATR